MKHINFLPIFLAVLMVSGVATAKKQLPPNAEKLEILLNAKIKQIKAADRYKMPSKSTNRRRQRRDLFKVKLGAKAIDYSKLDKVTLPVDPVKFSCTHPNVAAPIGGDPRYLAGRVKGKLRMANDYLTNKGGHHRYSPSGLCSKALYYIMSAYCMDYKNPAVLKAYRHASKVCRREYKRAWIYAIYNAKKQPIPLWAVSPSTTKANIKRTLRWATTYLKTTSKWYSTMLNYLDVLKVYPNNFDAINGFAYMYANYYGVTKAQATSHRKNNMLGGKFAKLSKPALYQAAIDELLAQNHAIIGKETPRLGHKYLDVNYLLTQVYLPAIEKHQNELLPYKCSVTLKRKMRAYDKAAVTKAMTSNRSPCKGYNAKVTGSDIMRYHTLRMKFIEILAKNTVNPTATISAAALKIVSQIGAPRSKVCWLWENPYPESIKPSAGVKAHCSAFGAKMHNVRPGFFNYVYQPHPVTKLTKLQITEAREILAKAGAAGHALDKRLKKAYKRAKGVKCLVWEVTVARTYLGGGRYGKLYRYSNGGPKEISCRKIRRNGQLKKVFKSWKNHFDTIYGGKMKGSWRVITNYYRRKLRKQRPALIYIKRKI